LSSNSFKKNWTCVNNTSKYFHFILSLKHNTLKYVQINWYLINNYYIQKPTSNNISLKSNAVEKKLLLNFKKNKFFPTLLNTLGYNYITLSLGTFAHFFNKPKSFKKSKQLYILLVNFLKNLLFYTKILYVSIYVKYIPKYFSEILNTLTSTSTTYLQNPYNKNFNLEKKNSLMQIKNLIFINTKPYGFFKNRKKGVIKRKISRKVFTNNNITD